MNLKNCYSFTFRSTTLLLLVLLLGNTGFAQQQGSGNSVLPTERNKADNSITSITFTSDTKWREDQANEVFNKYLGIDGIDNKMVLTYRTTTKSDVTAIRYHQYYKGIKAEFGTYSLTVKNGIITFITGNYYDFSSNPATTPSISETDAFSKALQFVGADRYMWQDPREEQRIKMMFHKPDTTFLPKGKLEWVEDYRSGVTSGDRKIHLAWAFDIFAAEPLSRAVVFVDAATGKILLSNTMIKHTAAVAHTAYSKAVPIETANIGTTYVLFDSTRGTGVHTLNMNNGSSYGAATEYSSVANTWPLATPDSIALDAHWGAEVVYDFWNTVMGRLSYDNADGILLQYVHYQSGYNNAFWDGTEMTYGDGTGCGSGFTPLTSLDVTGHEIGHGVCQYTANLVYASESGAMNEAFSDCWGATIENWGDPHETDAVAKSTWGIGEEIKCGNPMRRMDFPKLKGQPDTYGGTNWFNVVSCVPSGGNDECGVHNNSGVMNKWYFLITQGGSGTNDLGNAYTVTGLGFAKSRNILYQTELVLSSTADFALMRTTSISTTITLYGDCSPEVIAVTNAWYAVGVGAAYVAVPAAITPSVNICVSGTITLSDATPGGTWSSGAPTVATIGATTAILNGITPGTATITYSLGGLCFATTIATINAFPTATISPAVSAVLCAGGNVVLTAGSGAGYTYKWRLGGVIIPGATNSTYTATAGGDYTVSVTNSAGCAATSASTIVTSVTPPAAVITPASPTTFCAGGSATLNATSGVGYTYQWLLGGSPLPGSTSSTFNTGTAGSYAVTVTNSSGCSTTSASTLITVTPLPTAAITPAGPTTFCTPGSVLLNGNVAGGMTYQWQRGGISIAGATAASYTASLTGNYTVITTQTGCSATSAPVSVSAEVLAVAPVTGSFNVCTGLTTTLADATAGGSWTSGSPAIASVNVAGVVSGVSAGSALISYTYTNTCGTITTTVSMSVHAPTAVSGITGTLNVCQGSTTALSDVTPSGIWSSVTPANATISVAGVVTGVAAGSSVISYTVTNAFGCVSAATASLIVDPLPSSVISPSGTVAICPGGNITLNAASVAGYTYQWQNGGVGIPGATSAGYSVTIAGTFKAVITSSFGCITVSSPVTVTIDPSLLVTPSVAISATPGNVLCIAPSPVSFTATSVYGGATPSYQWFVNGAGAGMGATFGYTPANGDIVKVLMTSSAACVSPLTASHSDTMIISAMQTPSVTITASPAEICSGNTITFTAHPVYGGTAPIYHWSRNDTNVATGYGYVYMPHYGDVLKVTLYSNYPCLLRDTALSPQVILHPLSPVLNTINISVTQSSIGAGNLDTFIAIAPNGGTAPTYQWLRNGTPIAGATNSIYVTSSLNPGDVIRCEEISSKPCATPETAISGGIAVKVIPVGVHQLAANSNQFSLLPNPNNGSFVIEGSLKDITDNHVNIIVTDILGQSIYHQVCELQNGSLNQQINLGSQIANGIYMVNITSGEGHFVYRIVVDK